MLQSEKDALIEQENATYKKISRELYDEQQRISSEYHKKQSEVEGKKIAQKMAHAKRIDDIMAIDAERDIPPFKSMHIDNNMEDVVIEMVDNNITISFKGQTILFDEDSADEFIFGLKEVYRGFDK